MPIKDILRNINLFVDGRGHAGRVDEFDPPKLTVQTEEFRAGGMDAPVDLDMGLEMLEANLTLSGIDKEVIKLWGVYTEASTPLNMRAALVDEDGTVTPVEIRMRGKVKELDFGTWKPGERAPLKWVVSLRYYKYTQGGEVIHEIDVERMIRIVNGKDQLEEQRKALGI